MIAHATKKVITEKMDEDPAFYEKFSKLIQQAIEDFRAKRLSDLEYLNKVVDIRNKVVGKVHDDVPDILKDNEDAMAYYGILKPFFENCAFVSNDLDTVIADTAIAVYSILEKYKKINFWDDDDAQNQTVNDIDDYFYDVLKKEKGIELSPTQMDEIIEKVMQVRESRSHV